jgi:ATP-dependent helicase/nuclease subunit B
VVTPPASLRRHFLSWDRPLLPQAVAFLAGEWPGRGPLDLSHLLVLVPTRQSGRRLREALADYAAKHGAAVFPPRVMLPESLLTPAAADDVASRLESLLAWTEVLRGVELDACREVFPVDPPERSFAWAIRLAQDFTRLQHALAESGLQLADVPERLGADFPERERWQQLAELERGQGRVLAALGRRDAHAARIAEASQPALPPGVQRIVLLAAPDPQPLALAALAAHAREVPVDVVVFAPAEDAAAFDEWGRPRPDAWAARVIEPQDFEQHVHLCADPAGQARRIAALATSYGEPEGVLGVGVADPELLPVLENAIGQAALPAFNPEGRKRGGDRLFQLLTALAGLAREHAPFATVQALARCPDFLEFLRHELGAGFSAAKFLAGLDALHARHLPPNLAEARRHAPADDGLAAIERLRQTITTGTFPDNATAALEMIFRGRRFDAARADEAAAIEAARAWMEGLNAINRAADAFRGLTDQEWWDVALRLYGEGVRYEDKRAGAVELLGWLELLWEDAPHLVVAGFNDGRVPEAVVGDPFLPESLRGRLGLKTNAERFARDAYVLQAIAQCRAASGRLDLLLGKTSAAGDPLRPSRLLLRCVEAELPRRVDFLFRAADAEQPNPAWRRAWTLSPPQVSPPERVAVTGLRAWLHCPFRFYLRRVLRMEPVDPGKVELDALDFGTLCHAALEAMGKNEHLRDCADAGTLREFLLDTVAAEAARRFGPQLTLPLVVQLESARQRLSRAAEVQAQARAEGWVTEAVERPFELRIADLAVTGKIDRIDRHEATGAVRVLDYKTSDRAVDPAQAHLRSPRREERAPEFARFGYNAKEHVWVDLQLPLYLQAVAAGFAGGGAAAAECAYFNLPKAAGETAIRPWTDFTRELGDAAWRCAEGIAAAIRAGEFWPPNETIRPDDDDFAALFHHGVADSVSWRAAR